MARFFYTLLCVVALPVVLLRWLWRSRVAPGYRKRWGERFGLFRAPSLSDAIWVHCVSVGETIAAAPLVRALQQRYPERPLVVTTITPTGSERVRVMFGDSVFHVYAPYDLPFAVSNFLDRVQPAIALIMETELWPNLLHGCHARAIPVLVMNARLSARSAEGYRRIAPLTRAVLSSISEVVAQSEADAERFVALGLPRERVSVSGSIKFDITIDEPLRQQAARLRQDWDVMERFVWIGASTHDGEDSQLLEAQRRLLEEVPSALLILVPRHPERFGTVAELARKAGFAMARRAPEDPVVAAQVLLGDTMGELLLLYGTADCAFIGGSLVPLGGHNMLEPAAWRLPILTGPSDYNFARASDLLQQAGALTLVDDAQQLAGQLRVLATDTDERQRRGEAGLKVLERERGVLQRMLERVEHHLG